MNLTRHSFLQQYQVLISVKTFLKSLLIFMRILISLISEILLKREKARMNLQKSLRLIYRLPKILTKPLKA